MSLLDFQQSQRRLLDKALTLLERIGYDAPLIERGYAYTDRFAQGQPERKIDAAIFGREPVSYETATFGMVIGNGMRGAPLINEHRSLGAPLIIEFEDDSLLIWTIGGTTTATRLQHTFDFNQFHNWLNIHETDLRPDKFIRTKELRGGPAFLQESLFAGLIPELEETIGKTLDPLLRQVFSAGVAEYERTTGKRPAEAKLFKLAFWLLTGKVFADRGHRRFTALRKASDPDVVLRRVGDHYREELGSLLNRQTREVVFERIWNRLDFRNLSVEVLSQIWSRTLVSDETRKRLGIHRTRKSLVRYIIEQIPFKDFAPEERCVLEPCTGSAAFLIGAIDRMRDFPDMHDPKIRHAYFQRVLKGIEKDPFGVEIGRLCLALADYPNPNGWKITPGDVFDPDILASSLSEARIVLCNPPFEKFEGGEKDEYQASHWYKPAELLSRILRDLRGDAVLGFVVPRTFLDGKDYRDVRSALVRRFGKIDLVSLPDKGWDHISPETVLLSATRPRIGDRSSITHAIVKIQDWQQFDWSHEVRSRDTAEKTDLESETSLIVPELREIWEYLTYCPKLSAVATPSRAIEWNMPLDTHRDILVREEPFPGSRRGVPPLAKFDSFQKPSIKHLNFDEEFRYREAFDLPWAQPKVIMNKTRRSRGMWCVSAFADLEGLACYRTFIPVWPKDPALTVAVAAVLNGPVANAFIAAHSSKTFITHDNINAIPFPILSSRRIADINRLVASYQSAIEEDVFPRTIAEDKADRLLRQIDASILDAYGLPPRLERRLLDSFNGEKRIVPFAFADYFPTDFTPCFSLKEWLTGKPSQATAERFRSQTRDLPDHIHEALRIAGESPEEDE